jgi:hypothetical protein
MFTEATRSHQTLGASNSYRAEIFDTLLNVEVPGNALLTVGKTINIRIPPATDITDQNAGDEEDKYLSGKYLITKLRHKMGAKSGSEFVTVIECARIGDRQ